MQACRLELVGVVAALLGACGCRAQESAWAATWKLDRSRSHLVGPSITIAPIAGGYHFDFGAVAFDIGEDGREYPTVPTRTTILMRTGPRTWYRVHRTNGVEVDHGTLEVTADNAQMRIHTVATEPNGTTHESDETMVRVGAGSGLAGTWRSTRAGATVPERVVIAAEGGKLRWSYPAQGQSFLAALDGTSTVYEGPQAVPGITMSLTARGAREIHWTESAQGKPLTEGVDVLLGDGRSLEETNWPVARPGDRQDAVYVRQ